MGVAFGGKPAPGYKTMINEYGDEMREPRTAETVDLEVGERFSQIVEEALGKSEVSGEAAFDDAFARAQKNFQPVLRTREVEVKMRAEKGGGTYRFKYAPLEEILKKCLPALNAEGIGWKQFIRIRERMEGEERIFDHFVVSRLTYKGWKDEDEVMIFKTFPDAQSYAGAVTYAKRMGAQNKFGVAADDDNDGHGPGSEWIGGNAFGDQERGQQGGKSFDEAKEKPQDGRKGKPATGMPAGTGKPAAVDVPAKKAAARAYSEIELSRMEGQVVDAVAELCEACVEGRRIGIEQIWAECVKDEYVAQRVWTEMQTKTPDLFKIMKGVLKPEGDKKPRGPAPKES